MMSHNGQPMRVLRYLADNPGAGSLEITLHTQVVNVTGRVSDLRAAGHRIECRMRTDGVMGYWLVTAGQARLWS